MSKAVLSVLHRYRTHWAGGVSVALVLSMVSGVIAPDSVSGPDESTTVTITTIQPRVLACAIWSQGNDGAIDIGAIGDTNPGGDDVNRTGAQVQVGIREGGASGWTKSQSADPDDLLYFYVRVTINTGDADSGGIKSLVNVTIKGWFEDGNVAGSSDTYAGFNSTPGKNTNFEIVHFGTKALQTDNSTEVLWPSGTTHSPNGSIGEVRRRGALTNGSFLANQNEIRLGIPIDFNNNFRWAKNATDGLSEAWRFRCLAGMKDGGAETNTPDVYSTHRSWNRASFGTYKHSRFAVSGSFAGTFAPGGPELPFPTSPDQTMYYYSNAPYNVSINISNLRPTLNTPPCTTSPPGAFNPTCINSRSVGLDVGQMDETADDPWKNCLSNSCWRFFWDNASSPATRDGFLWVRGGNGTGAWSDLGPASADAGVYKARWLNTTCGSEEWDPDTGTTCDSSGFLENEDVTAEWFAQVPVGILEGTYITRITYWLRTHPNPTPVYNSEPAP
jgi:hypothetical protein